MAETCLRWSAGRVWMASVTAPRQDLGSPTGSVLMTWSRPPALAWGGRLNRGPRRDVDDVATDECANDCCDRHDDCRDDGGSALPGVPE
jgi:hypothetical protein